MNNFHLAIVKDFQRMKFQPAWLGCSNVTPVTYTGVADIFWKQRDGDTALTLQDNEPDRCYIGFNADTDFIPKNLRINVFSCTYIYLIMCIFISLNLACAYLLVIDGSVSTTLKFLNWISAFKAHLGFCLKWSNGFLNWVRFYTCFYSLNGYFDFVKIVLSEKIP